MRGLPSRVRGWLGAAGGELTGHMLALYAAHFFKVLLPLVTVPYLARVLGAETLGLLAFVQAYAVFVGLLLEFGFTLSQTREVARHRDSPGKLAELAAGTLGAQGILALVAVAATLPVQASLPAFRDHPRLVWLAVAAGVCQGASFLWFLRGVERMRLVAVLEVLPRMIRTAGIFLLVRRPADVWLVAAADAAGNAVGAALGAGVVYRMVPFRWAGGRRILDTLRASWNLFVVRFAASLFAAGNVFVLGVFVPTAVVGYYTGAEKISNAVRMLFNPIYDALYPRVSHLAQRSRRRAFDFTRATLAVMATLALLGSAVIFFGAPWIVRILLGPGFEPAVPVLRIFSLLPPVVVVNLSLGTHGLLVQGRQGLYSGVGLATGVLTVLLTLGGAALLPDYGHWAAAASYIASQLVMAVIFARAMVGIHRRLAAEELGAEDAP